MKSVSGYCVCQRRLLSNPVTYENVEKILRQLESQREDINNQKILVQQILSKFPIQVLIKLEELKGLQDLRMDCHSTEKVT